MAGVFPPGQKLFFPPGIISLMTQDLIHELEKKLQQPLPGRPAQLEMAHITRQLYRDAPSDARQAAVLAVLFQKDERWHTILIERNANDRDHHAGQISFPGGKFEPEDSLLSNTALRETEEEIGLPGDKVRLLGRLTDLYIPVSNFQVHPFVGFINFSPSYRLQEEEVQSVFEVPLEHFTLPQVRKRTDIQIARQLLLKNVPYFDIEGKVLWGATAMIISELNTLISNYFAHERTE
ncbi:MAG: hypothetical protein RI973_408 [Bacteroidota bacterium]|jgi:8-oxo-dGTP pyrophosphatase MutT (NUDIX family)